MLTPIDFKDLLFAKGGKNDMKLNQVYVLSDLAKIEFEYPSLEEQNRIVEFLELTLKFNLAIKESIK